MCCIGPGLLFLLRVRLMITRFNRRGMDGLCYEFHFISRMWVTSLYVDGVFERYTNKVHSDERQSDFQSIIIIQNYIDPPANLMEDHQLYQLYTQFLERKFLFTNSGEKKSIQIIDLGLDRWYPSDKWLKVPWRSLAWLTWWTGCGVPTLEASDRWGSWRAPIW